MRASTPRLPAAVTAALVAAVVAGAAMGGAVTTLAGVAPASATSATAQADGDVRQAANGDLVVELDASEVNESNAVTIAVADQTYERPGSGNQTLTYTVAAGELPDGGVADTNVTVTQDGDRLATATLDLRYLRLSDGPRFDDRGRLVLNVDRSVGVAGATVNLTVTGNGATEQVPVDVGADGSTVRLARTQSFVETALLPPTSITVGDADGGATVPNEVTVPIPETVSSGTTVSVVGDTVVVESPLLVGGAEYDVTVQTTEPSGEYQDRATAGQPDNGIARLTVENGEVTAASELTASVTYRGTDVTSATATTTTAPLSATLEYNGSGDNATVINVSGMGDVGTVEKVLLKTANDVYAVNEVNRDGSLLRFPNLSVTSGRYELAVIGADGTARLTVGEGALGEVGGDEAISSGSDSGVGRSSGTSLSPRNVLVVLVALVLGGGGVYALLSVAPGGSGGRRRSRRAGGARTASVQVTVRDEQTGHPVDGGRVVARKAGRNEFNTEGPAASAELVDGTADLTLEPGPSYRVEAQYGGTTAVERVENLASDRQLSISLPPLRTQLSVVDDRSEPVTEADVSLTGADVSGERAVRDDGTIQLKLSPVQRDITLTVEHDRLTDETVHVDEPADLPSRVVLGVPTGSVTASLSIDGEATDCGRIELEPAEGWLRDRVDVEYAEVSDGEVSFESLPAGAYEVTTAVGGEQFDTATETVRVQNGGRARARLDVSFEYDLSADQRNRLAELQTAADDLVPTSQLDGAVHRYYASVVRSLVSEIERVPRLGARFAGADVGPDETVEALLWAGESLLDIIDPALNTKHNVDLFSACANMRQADIRWESGYELDSFFELAAADRGEQRSRLRAALSEAESTVEAERSEVTVASPARAVMDELQSHVQDTRESDEVRHAALTVVVVGLADAVETLFDHPELRDRLNRTVY
ncbi:MAG: hypothetical protein ABEJ79_06495 [Halolamina sp.]